MACAAEPCSSPAPQISTTSWTEQRSNPWSALARPPDRTALDPMTPYSQPRLYSVAWRAACRRSARDEPAELDAALTALAREATPSNLSLLSIGVDHAGQLLIT